MGEAKLKQIQKQNRRELHQEIMRTFWPRLAKGSVAFLICLAIIPILPFLGFVAAFVDNQWLWKGEP